MDESLCAGSGGGDPGSLTITNVASKKLKGTKFEISWTTDVPCRQRGDVRLLRQLLQLDAGDQPQDAVQRLGRLRLCVPVKSTDADGHSSTAGPFHHQN